MSVMTRHGWSFSVKEVIVGTLLVTVVMWGAAFGEFDKTGAIPLIGAFQEGFGIGVIFSVLALGAPAIFIHHLFNYKKLRKEEREEELRYRLEKNQRQQRECPHKLEEEEKELKAELGNL